MPEISRFLGIVITMYFNDHMPPRITGLSLNGLRNIRMN